MFIFLNGKFRGSFMRLPTILISFSTFYLSLRYGQGCQVGTLKKTDTLDLFPSSVWERKIEGLDLYTYTQICISVSGSSWNFQPDKSPQNRTVRFKTGHLATLASDRQPMLFNIVSVVLSLFIAVISVRRTDILVKCNISISPLGTIDVAGCTVSMHVA